jgi:hypothetical protein
MQKVVALPQNEQDAIARNEIRRIVRANIHRVQRPCPRFAGMHRCGGNARRDQAPDERSHRGHLECMREFGYAIPEPTTVAEQVEIPI